MSPHQRVQLKAVTGTFLFIAFWFIGIFKCYLRHKLNLIVPDVFTQTFNCWDSHPFTQHLFLGQGLTGGLDKGTAYPNYTYPYLLGVYCLLAPLHFCLGLSYELAQNFLPYAYYGVFLGWIFYAQRKTLYRIWDNMAICELIALFLCTGLIICCSTYWIALIYFGADNMNALYTMIFCFLSVDFFKNQYSPPKFLFCGLAIACLCPFFIPPWFLLRLAIEKNDLRINNKIGPFRDYLIVGVASVFNLFLQRTVCHSAGLISLCSDFSYRSGLDGSTQYFQNIIQAIYHPTVPPGRMWPFGLFIGFVLIFYILNLPQWQEQNSTSGNKSIYPLNQALCLIIPYLTIAIIFPQMTSIHPYFTDISVILPCCFLLFWWSLEENYLTQLRGIKFACWVVGISYFIMSNLLCLAQAFRKVM